MHGQRTVASTSQASLEAVLREHVRKLGGEIEMGVELVGIEQDKSGVLARLVKRTEGRNVGADIEDVLELGKEERDEIKETGVEETVRCAFLVGTDGARGTGGQTGIRRR